MISAGIVPFSGPSGRLSDAGVLCGPPVTGGSDAETAAAQDFHGLLLSLVAHEKEVKGRFEAAEGATQAVLAAMRAEADGIRAALTNLSGIGKVRYLSVSCWQVTLLMISDYEAGISLPKFVCGARILSVLSRIMHTHHSHILVSTGSRRYISVPSPPLALSAAAQQRAHGSHRMGREREHCH